MTVEEIQAELDLMQKSTEGMQKAINALKENEKELRKWKVAELHNPITLHHWQKGSTSQNWTGKEIEKIKHVLNNEFLEIPECREAFKKWINSLNQVGATTRDQVVYYLTRYEEDNK